ncbi:hypothetical protein P7C70_g86, partial [Phenoliferia sp. Uapishka_3]
MDPLDQLPDLRIFAFVVPVFLQCVLLHPVFPDSISRPLRALLVLPSVLLAYKAPLLFDGFNEKVVLANFFLGIASAYGIWKTFEYGFVADRTPYTWIGLDSDQVQDSAAGDGKRKLPLRKDKARLQVIRRKKAQEDDVPTIMRDSLHLALSMRGTGYAFGPAVSILQYTAFPTSPLSAFVRAHLIELLRSHIVVLSWAAMTTADPKFVQSTLSSFLPFLSPKITNALYVILSTVTMGFGVNHGLNLMYSVFTLTVLLLTSVASILPFTSSLIPPFDPRQYHRLFYNTWHLESVG